MWQTRCGDKRPNMPMTYLSLDGICQSTDRLSRSIEDHGRRALRSGQSFGWRHRAETGLAVEFFEDGFNLFIKRQARLALNRKP
jgi:hypothetical protein